MEEVSNHSEAGWLAGGVQFHIPGNGGPGGVQFLSAGQRMVETVVFSLGSIFLLIWSYRALSPVQNMDAHVLDRPADPDQPEQHDLPGHLRPFSRSPLQGGRHGPPDHHGAPGGEALLSPRPLGPGHAESEHYTRLKLQRRLMIYLQY
eukprot:GFUD01105173.1.p1 GENE.GFUD01105173.1~~GFUD01105173.1.p1  ORF type:complete len:148 (-),score=27.32 GFUD01105173.1:74-517(-)